MWSGKCSVKCGVWSVKCAVRSWQSREGSAKRAENASDLSVLFFLGLYMFVICLYFRTVMAAMARFEIIFYWHC